MRPAVLSTIDMGRVDTEQTMAECFWLQRSCTCWLSAIDCPMIAASIYCNPLHCRFTKVDEKAHLPIHRPAMAVAYSVKVDRRFWQYKRPTLSEFWSL
jgi:hypothetical protein